MSIITRVKSKYLDEWFKPKDRSVVDAEGVVISSLDDAGREILDDTPMAPPVGLSRTPPMWEVIRDMVRSERLAQAASESGHETFEEADDFDIPDDPGDPYTPWENDFDPSAKELHEALAQDKAAKKAAEGGTGAKPLSKEPAGDGAGAPKGGLPRESNGESTSS